MVSTAASSRASNAAPLASGSCLLYYCTLTNLLTLLLYIIISANIAFYIRKYLYFPQNSGLYGQFFFALRTTEFIFYGNYKGGQWSVVST